jgi:hypothetical protein
MMGNMPHPGRHVQFRRIGRGGFVPPFWFGPRFHVRNYGLYGFPRPFQGGRWVRYYDDALLIDRNGRVHDSRDGYDWDRYGERWSYGDRGIPEYVGDGDYEPEDRDYEWAEDYERGGRGEHHARRHDGPPLDCDNPCTRVYHGAPPPLPPHGYFGYGPVVVTETITTTAPVYEEVTTYEHVRKPARVKPRHRGKVIRPAPHHPGEKG